AKGSWRRYYRRWESMTLEQLDTDLVGLVPELLHFAPPAQLEDKTVLSAWTGSLHARLSAAGVGSIIISGAETEICVLATIMGAVDLGYRVIIVSDAVCSGADSTHDAMLAIYQSRFSMQVETVTTAQLLAARLDDMLWSTRSLSGFGPRGALEPYDRAMITSLDHGRSSPAA